MIGNNLKKFSVLSLLLGLVFLALASQGSSYSVVQEFNQGWKKFHNLRKSPEKAKFRSYWMGVKKHFWKVYSKDPKGSYAPKALYYLGRTYQELGKRSYLKQDFITALDYFSRLIKRFPEHSWADDGKYYQAKIRLNNLKDPDQAYLDLLSIVHNYPKADMVPKAKSLLDKLDKKYMQEVGVSKEKKRKAIREKLKVQKKAEKGEANSNSGNGLQKLMDIRHWSSDDYTRVVLDLDDSTEYEHFLLNPDPKLHTPHRLVVDLEKTLLSQDIDHEFKIQDGILKKVRSGQYRKSISRVVLDVAHLDDYRVFSLDNPFRVVLDVYAPKAAKQKKGSKEKKQDYNLDDKSKEYSGSLVQQLGLDIRTVMLDPGHGGKDPGAVYGKLYEKDINLKLAKFLGKKLKSEGYRVLYTRTSDKFIPLEERTALANSRKADLFISLHVNAHQNSRINGFEVYFLNLAKSKDAVRVAARENSVSTKKISDLQVILTDLMLNSKIKESRSLADTVLDQTLKESRKRYKLNDHGVRQAPFYVLMGAKMPAILVEVGYISNARDRKKLQSDAFLKRVAQGIAKGISSYRKEITEYARLK